jgi:uncharacterized oligopeptide transporter (OPT) family protein
MAEPSAATPPPANGNGEAHKPFVPDEVIQPEFTWSAVILGALLGIVFGASSLYLLLKVGMTVSASVPIAVLSITLFRAFARGGVISQLLASIPGLRGFAGRFGTRRATILENNIVQTTGSAGESIAFGVGVTMPALFLLGYEMEWSRVMTVSVLGGLLGILMMIPLRRAFIVKQHKKLAYPEGTACAEVLVAGEKGGMTARMVFLGFGIAAAHKFLTAAAKLWAGEPFVNLFGKTSGGARWGFKGAALSGELSPELLGVGYLIGPRIAALLMGGAVLSYLVIGPMIAHFGDSLNTPLSPAKSNLVLVADEEVTEREGVLLGDTPGDIHGYWRVAGLVGSLGGNDGLGAAIAVTLQGAHRVEDTGLIHNMGPGEIKGNYLRYIGAGAVAAGGIISMLRALPLIFSSIVSGLRDLRSTQSGGPSTKRTEQDMSMKVVIYGSLGLVLIMMLIPSLGLGRWNEGFFPMLAGFLGALMILLFGFLFVTVSSRLTGEVGSSSNPISGMTIATLLMTCLIFFIFGLRDVNAWLMALTIAAVVCIASSNGGTTSQDLKTGFLVGATPRWQQWAIGIGALTSALVIGVTMLLLNAAGSHYTNQGFPKTVKLDDLPVAVKQEKPGKPHGDDPSLYRVVHVTEDYLEKKEQDAMTKDLYKELKPGRYLIDENGYPAYRTDLPIKRVNETMDGGGAAPKGFSAPQPELFSSLIKGILGGKLEWSLVILGALIAITLELVRVPALPFAVGMYIPFGSTASIFVGGMLRWLTDRLRGKSASETETETSPGVLLSSGYIAGGTLCGLIVLFFAFSDDLVKFLDVGRHLDPYFGEGYADGKAVVAKVVSVVMYAVLVGVLFYVGSRKTAGLNGQNGSAGGTTPPA